MKKSSFSIFLLATVFFSCGQKAGNGQTTALTANDTTTVIEQLAKQTVVDDTLYCIKLMNQAITARYGVDGPNFLQDVLHEKMGCTVCSEDNNKEMYDVMLWVLSKIEKGDLMRFWQFYWSSLSNEEDGGAVNHDHDREVERILSLMDKYSPEMKRAAYIAYEYFSNGVMSDDWYPYPEDYIKAVKPYAERYKHKFWMPKFEDRVDSLCRCNADSVVYYLYEAPYGQTAENNVIELRFENGKVHDGYFWGTSDEFVNAREGYYPGFAVWHMMEIQSTGDTFSFLIDSRGVDYSSAPISTDIHQMTEAFEKGYHPWEQQSKFFQDTVRYTCTFTPEVFTINRKSKYDNGTRRFTRKFSE